MSDNDFVTIVVYSKDAELRVSAAIDSVLSQSRRPDCILIAEHQSEDGTWAAIGEWFHAHGHAKIPWVHAPELNVEVDDTRIQAIRFRGSNAGAAYNRCMSIRWGDTTIFGFLDARDQYLPGKTERSLAAFAESDAVVAVVTDHLVEQEGTEKRVYLPAYHNVRSLAGPTYGSAFFAKKGAISASGPFDEGLQVHLEHEWLTRLAERGVVYHVPEALHRSVFKSPGDSDEQFMVAIANRAIERRGAAR